MPRNIPECPSKPTSPPTNEHSYEIELITPMFGGGVETRVNDPSFPIRPTSIRGQLQFWWRATVGAQYATRQELRAAQSAVWGDTTRASRVQVRVEDVHADKPAQCAHYEYKRPSGDKRARHDLVWNEPFSIPEKRHWGTEYVPKPVTYALFPFQGEKAKRIEPGCKPEVEPAYYIPSAKFRLTILCHKSIDFAKEVEPALWAWVNFGGLGSRTRRGCGAIVCKALAPKDADELKAMWLRHMPALPPLREWPTIAECVLHDKEQPGAINAWDRVIERFRHFRQGVKLGRNEGQQPNRPGRSRYSEPETIRRVTGRRIARHARLPRIPDDAFPRAELGLPIVFHFQDEQNGEPPDTVLYPDNDSEGKRRERMASPLILKPLALQSGKAVPLILHLKTAALTGVDLRIKRKDLSSLPRELADQVRSTMQPNDNEGSLPLPDPTRLVDPNLSGYPNSPLAGSPNGSAIEAFLAFARAEGFTEVTR